MLLLNYQKGIAHQIVENFGVNGYISIADKVENQSAYAKCFIDAVLSNQFQWDIIEQLKAVSCQCADIVVSILYHEKAFQLDVEFFSQLEDDDKIWILSCIPVNSEVVTFIEKHFNSLSSEHWKLVSLNFCFSKDKDLITHCLPHIINAQRAYCVLRGIAYSDYDDIPSLLSILHAVFDEYCNKELKDKVVHFISSHCLEKIFKKLYRSEEEYRTEIARLELIYLRVMDCPPRCLQYEIFHNPTMFIELLQLAYKADYPPGNSETGFNTQAANNAYDILEQMETIPGYNSDTGELDSEHFRTWTESVFSLAKNEDYLNACEHVFGNMISFSPIGKDGIWPAECVRDFLETHHSCRICEAICIGIYNQRGVFTATGGEEELKIAQKYTAYAEQLELFYPHTATIVHKIAEQYYHESQQERQSEMIPY